MAWILSQCALYFHINGKRTSLLRSSFSLLWKAAHDNRAMRFSRYCPKVPRTAYVDHFWKKKKFLDNTTTLFVAWVSGLARSQGLAHLRPLEWAGESYQLSIINQAECNRVLTSQSQSSKKWDRGTWLDFRWSVSPAELEAIVEGARWSLSTANEFDHLDGGQDDQATVSLCKMI